MKKSKTLVGSLWQGALQGAVIFTILQLIHDRGSFAAVPAKTVIGLVVGAVVGPIGWLVRKRLNHRRQEDIEQGGGEVRS